MWRSGWKTTTDKAGKKNRKVKPLYGPCDRCRHELRSLLGCPFDGFEGKAVAKFAHVDGGADFAEKPFSSCPEYYVAQPAIQEIWELVADYKRGALGPIWDLPNTLLLALQTLDAEQETFKSHLMEAD